MAAERYDGLDDFLRRGRAALDGSPIALIMVEDATEIESTLAHHDRLGFRSIVVFAPDAIGIAAETDAPLHRVAYDALADHAVPDAINRIIAAAPGRWLYYCYNAEYLFYPFCETRSVGEMLAFHAEERRDAMLTYVIDLYADDLERFPDAVSRETALLDRSGYYAQARPDATNRPLERQLDFFGGLKRRFEEHVPGHRRRIDRIALFRARRGLRLLDGHLFDDAEYNTYACPWHNNLTAAVCSFRTAKALKTNAGSTFDIAGFRWRNSVPFRWESRQLLDLGLMEPGQWF